MNRISIICKLSCTSSRAMLRCSVSWVSSIKKRKANTQEVPALAHSPFSSSSTPSCLNLYPRRVKSPGRADHSCRLRDIDVRVQGGSRLILHTHTHTDWSWAKAGRGKTGIHSQTKTSRTKKKKSNCQCFIHNALRKQMHCNFWLKWK